MVVFDLETTGTNISQDRIVEIAMVKAMPDGTIEEKCRKINPTIPIPNETSLIHGIYDEDVKDEPTFAQIAKSLAQYLEGCDLAGFNVLGFDVPMLVEEFLRANVRPKARFRNQIFTALDANHIRQHAAVAGSNIGKRPRMHQRRGIFQRL